MYTVDCVIEPSPTIPNIAQGGCVRYTYLPIILLITPVVLVLKNILLWAEKFYYKPVFKIANSYLLRGTLSRKFFDSNARMIAMALLQCQSRLRSALRRNTAKLQILLWCGYSIHNALSAPAKDGKCGDVQGAGIVGDRLGVGRDR